jgi:hypothetical protein
MTSDPSISESLTNSSGIVRVKEKMVRNQEGYKVVTLMPICF